MFVNSDFFGVTINSFIPFTLPSFIHLIPPFALVFIVFSPKKKLVNPTGGLSVILREEPGWRWSRLTLVLNILSWAADSASSLFHLVAAAAAAAVVATFWWRFRAAD